MHELRLDFGDNRTRAQIALGQERNLPLRDFLVRFPARAATPIDPAWLDLPLRAFRIVPVKLEREPEANGREQDDRRDERRAAGNAEAPEAAAPLSLTDGEAVARAYADEIAKIGRYLSSDLSVLAVCDKVLAEHIARHAVRQSNKRPLIEGETGVARDEDGLLQRNMIGAGMRIAGIGRLLAGIKSDQVLVLRHLDMLAGGSPDGPLNAEARMLTETLYRSPEFTPTLLGFIDPSIGLPRVLANRFAVRIELGGLRREILPGMITRAERERFADFDAETLFKNVSGFNAIQLRDAMRYLHANSQPGSSTRQLTHLIREFKRGGGEDVAIPDVSFDQIGGYTEVKRELFGAIELITGKPVAANPDGSPYTPPSDAERGPESAELRALRRKLAPRGFIFHGPPGTGKTLFAKAIANAMNATIQMVSGPEIMDMWVGKSESNLRRIFAIARRNAPAVIFFDEFDSIAARRGNLTDGASRASNAVVAQLLTELDGFRDDQDLLVIGTTNRLDIIDAALLRPSRFQPVEIGLPDVTARRRIAAIHAHNFGVPLPDADMLDQIAAETEGFNGDEIRAIFQAIARAMLWRELVTHASFESQIALLRERRQRQDGGQG